MNTNRRLVASVAVMAAALLSAPGAAFAGTRAREGCAESYARWHNPDMPQPDGGYVTIDFGGDGVDFTTTMWESDGLVGLGGLFPGDTVTVRWYSADGTLLRTAGHGVVVAHDHCTPDSTVIDPLPTEPSTTEPSTVSTDSPTTASPTTASPTTQTAISEPSTTEPSPVSSNSDPSPTAPPTDVLPTNPTPGIPSVPGSAPLAAGSETTVAVNDDTAPRPNRPATGFRHDNTDDTASSLVDPTTSAVPGSAHRTTLPHSLPTTGASGASAEVIAGSAVLGVGLAMSALTRRRTRSGSTVG